MYVTLLQVKCKTRKCGQTIPVDKLLASDEVRRLSCAAGHENNYRESDLQTRTEKIKPLRSRAEAVHETGAILIPPHLNRF
jgi:hypothetical protein